MRTRRKTNATLLQRLAKCQDGTMAAEFAVGATVALALIFAVIDVGRVFIVNGLLGDAVRQISRENQVREVAYDAGQFSNAAAATISARAAGMLDPGEVIIETTVFDSFEALAANQEDGSAPPGGDPGQIVKYRLTYDMDYYTPFVGMLMDSVNFNHIAEIIVYNEPGTTS